MKRDTLNAAFDIDASATSPDILPADTALTVTPASVPAPVRADIPETDPTLQKDFDFARETIRDAIQRASIAAIDAVALAQSGDSPRAYEVVGNMLTAIVSANKELVELHRSREETKKTQRALAQPGGNSSEQNVTIEKAVFVGRAADLLREIRNLQKIEK